MRHQQREEFAIGFLIWSLPVVSHAEDTDVGPLLSAFARRDTRLCHRQGSPAASYMSRNKPRMVSGEVRTREGIGFMEGPSNCAVATSVRGWRKDLCREAGLAEPQLRSLAGGWS